MSEGKIALELIKESPVALRAVNRKSEEYIQLVQSVIKVGILSSITVREVKDPVTGMIYYGLINGLQRFSAAKDAGLLEIPVTIIDINDAQLLEAQIIANIHTIETKPAEYTQQLLRILSSNPLLTIRELAQRLCQSESWLIVRLSLSKLKKEIQELVDQDKLKLANAYALAKLPEEEQASFLDRAITDNNAEFIPAIRTRIKELRDARSKGTSARDAEFHPVEHFQKMVDIKSAMTDPSIASTICASENAKTVQEGFVAAIKWCLNVDRISTEKQKVKDDERKRRHAEEKERAKNEREERKAREAAATVVDITKQ